MNANGGGSKIADFEALEIHAIVVTDDYRARLANAGLEPVVDSTPAGFQKQISDEIAMFGKIIRANGLSID